jgi:hypothetical protein
MPICDECDIKYSNENMKAEGSKIVTNGGN